MPARQGAWHGSAEKKRPSPRDGFMRASRRCPFAEMKRPSVEGSGSRERSEIALRSETSLCASGKILPRFDGEAWRADFGQFAADY